MSTTQRVSDMLSPTTLSPTLRCPFTYRDGFGNWCSRIVAPKGEIRISTTAVVDNLGLPNPVVPTAPQHLVQEFPEETLVYLLGSRYCETDLLSQFAWDRFGNGPTGWGRVQAIWAFVHDHITFGYEYARPTKPRGKPLMRGKAFAEILRTWALPLPLYEYSCPLLHRLPG